jgi:cytochrome c553
MKIRKIFNKRKMALGILAGVYLFAWVPIILADDDDDGIDPEKNIIAIHDSSSRQYNKECISCHADIPSAQSLDPSIPNVHVAMIPFTPGEKDEETCIVCHRTVDLVQGSAGNIRKQVKATLCAMCHGPSGPAKQFYQADLALDGPALYDLACAACHRDLANSEVRGESLAEIQEKINENEGGMGPLGVLSTEKIQAIAAALAESGGDDDDSDDD